MESEAKELVGREDALSERIPRTSTAFTSVPEPPPAEPEIEDLGEVATVETAELEASKECNRSSSTSEPVTGQLHERDRDRRTKFTKPDVKLGSGLDLLQRGSTLRTELLRGPTSGGVIAIDRSPTEFTSVPEPPLDEDQHPLNVLSFEDDSLKDGSLVVANPLSERKNRKENPRKTTAQLDRSPSGFSSIPEPPPEDENDANNSIGSGRSPTDTKDHGHSVSQEREVLRNIRVNYDARDPTHRYFPRSSTGLSIQEPLPSGHQEEEAQNLDRIERTSTTMATISDQSEMDSELNASTQDAPIPVRFPRSPTGYSTVPDPPREQIPRNTTGHSTVLDPPPFDEAQQGHIPRSPTGLSTVPDPPPIEEQGSKGKCDKDSTRLLRPSAESSASTYLPPPSSGSAKEHDEHEVKYSSRRPPLKQIDSTKTHPKKSQKIHAIDGVRREHFSEFTLTVTVDKLRKVSSEAESPVDLYFRIALDSKQSHFEATKTMMQLQEFDQMWRKMYPTLHKSIPRPSERLVRELYTEYVYGIKSAHGYPRSATEAAEKTSIMLETYLRKVFEVSSTRSYLLEELNATGVQIVSSTRPAALSYHDLHSPPPLPLLPSDSRKDIMWKRAKNVKAHNGLANDSKTNAEMIQTAAEAVTKVYRSDSLATTVYHFDPKERQWNTAKNEPNAASDIRVEHYSTFRVDVTVDELQFPLLHEQGMFQITLVSEATRIVSFKTMEQIKMFDSSWRKVYSTLWYLPRPARRAFGSGVSSRANLRSGRALAGNLLAARKIKSYLSRIFEVDCLRAWLLQFFGITRVRITSSSSVQNGMAWNAKSQIHHPEIQIEIPIELKNAAQTKGAIPIVIYSKKQGQLHQRRYGNTDDAHQKAVTMRKKFEHKNRDFLAEVLGKPIRSSSPSPSVSPRSTVHHNNKPHGSIKKQSGAPSFPGFTENHHVHKIVIGN